MSKYVIDLCADCKVVEQIRESDGNVFVTLTRIDNLEKLNADYVNENFGILQDDAYNAGFEEGKKEAYQKGFEDGKAVYEKGCEGCNYAVMGSDATICSDCCNAYHNQWTAKSDKIEVGDEVLWDGEKHVVTYINRDIDTVKYNDGDVDLVEVKDYDLMSEDGSVIDHVSKYAFTKTGRHFDIKGILEAMHG